MGCNDGGTGQGAPRTEETQDMSSGGTSVGTSFLLATGTDGTSMPSGGTSVRTGFLLGQETVGPGTRGSGDVTIEGIFPGGTSARSGFVLIGEPAGVLVGTRRGGGDLGTGGISRTS